MIRASSRLLALLLAVLGIFAAYRIVAIAQADRLASTQPARALQWVPHHPQALLALAEQQLAAGRPGEARTTARQLLAVEPLEGRGFRVLAQAAERQGMLADSARLYLIAVRRSPRDIPTRAWLIEHLLVTGHYGVALEQIDYLLRIAPGQHATLLPLLVQLSVDPDFAIALAHMLEQGPPWQSSLETLRLEYKHPRAGDNGMRAMARDTSVAMDAGSPAPSAAQMAGRMEVAATILRNIDPRDTIPAGR